MGSNLSKILENDCYPDFYFVFPQWKGGKKNWVKRKCHFGVLSTICMHQVSKPINGKSNKMWKSKTCIPIRTKRKQNLKRIRRYTARPQKTHKNHPKRTLQRSNSPSSCHFCRI